MSSAIQQKLKTDWAWFLGFALITAFNSRMKHWLLRSIFMLGCARVGLEKKVISV